MTTTSAAADDRLSTPEAYDRRRSGSGSVTRPSYIRHTTIPRVRSYHPAQRPTLADLMTKVYGTKVVVVEQGPQSVKPLASEPQPPRARRVSKGGRRHG